jgi:hypothetical protein
MHSTGLKEECCTKIVCYATFPCQRKMHADYPSVAKPCTSVGSVLAFAQRPRHKPGGVENHESQRLHGFYGSERPDLPRSFRVYTTFSFWISLLTQALAPKMLGLLG